MNDIDTTTQEINLYYTGFNANCRYDEEEGRWRCYVLNSTDPIDFVAQKREDLQEIFREYILNYYEHCKLFGTVARKRA